MDSALSMASAEGGDGTDGPVGAASATGPTVGTSSRETGSISCTPSLTADESSSTTVLRPLLPNENRRGLSGKGCAIKPEAGTSAAPVELRSEPRRLRASLDRKDFLDENVGPLASPSDGDLLEGRALRRTLRAN